MSQKSVLSKSTFLQGLQCDKRLYLYKHHYNWQDKISEMQQSVFDRGHQVGRRAQELFPNGIDASPASPRAYAKAVEYTRELIEDGAEVIYEAAFIYNEVLIYADILVRNGNKWKVYEVKSSTSISETNIIDVSVQYYVISNAGIEIEDISIIYINNEYVRFGDLDLHQLFRIESILPDVVDNQLWVDEEVEILKGVIAKESFPQIDIGLHCNDPYACSFIGHCWKDIPDNSVFDISRMHLTKKFELYEEGIISLDDFPDDYILPASQRLQIDAHKSGETYIDRESIKAFLELFDYPLYFMDFESFQPAIPLYDNSKPYQQITFQYSLHYKMSEESELEHYDFLAEAGSDPRITFIEHLIEDTKSPGKIVVYNKSFEISRLKEIARNFPQYEFDIEDRTNRIIDLMIPFQKKWYYTPEMKGSYSIKALLPALIPELSYEDLNISDGRSASIAYEQLLDETDLIKISETRKDLEEYCKKDTFAMVKILEKMRWFY